MRAKIEVFLFDSEIFQDASLNACYGPLFFGVFYLSSSRLLSWHMNTKDDLIKAGNQMGSILHLSVVCTHRQKRSLGYSIFARDKAVAKGMKIVKFLSQSVLAIFSKIGGHYFSSIWRYISLGENEQLHIH